MHEVGRSVLQFVLDQGSIEEDLPMMLRVAEKTRCPISFSVAQADKAPRRWRQTLDTINEASAEVWRSPRRSPRARSGCCRTGTVAQPVSDPSELQAIAKLPLTERLAACANPTRAQLS